MRRLSFRERLKLALPILIALGLLCAGALFCWFNPDMRDAFKQALGIEVHRRIEPVGYYGQAIPVTQDLSDVARIAEDDAAAARYESNIPIVESPLASTLEIDGMGLMNIDIRFRTFYKGKHIFRIGNRPEGGAVITVGGEKGAGERGTGERRAENE